MSKKSEQELFQDTITPQNLKDNETISKLMKIYLDNLKGQEEYTKDPTKLLETDYLIKNMGENSKLGDVKKELFKIHLDEIYNVFENIENSENIYNKYKEIYNILNISTDNLKINFDVDNKVDDEYITASTGFKSKKGTRAGFFFVNDIINKVNIDPMNADSFFKLEEGAEDNAMLPYTYTVKASMYKEVFKETILPLSHPVGFDWHFLRLLYLTLTDYFGLIETSTITGMSLACDIGGDITKQKIVTKGEDINGNAISVPIVPEVNTQINFGTPSGFFESKDQDNRDKTVIDFYALNPYPVNETKQQGLRVVRDYDGRIVVYQKQREIQVTDENGESKIINIEIEKVELLDERQGKLTPYYKKVLTQDNNKGGFTEETVIDSVRFEEYSIFDLNEVKIRYSIKYGTPLSQGEDLETKRIWYVAVIPLSSKVISSDKKFFEKVNVTSAELLDNSTDYNGRVYDDREYNCSLSYDIDKRYEITTDDDSEYVKNIRSARKSTKYIKENGQEGWTDNSENTVQETDEKDTHDMWARLDPSAGVVNIGQVLPYTPIIGAQHGDDNNLGFFPIAGDTPIHNFDKGVNYQMSPDADLNSTYMGTLDHNNLYNTISTSSDYFVNHGEKIRRNEAYFAPSTYKDLADLGVAHINKNNVYSYEQTTDSTDTTNVLNKDEQDFDSITNIRVLGGQGPLTPAIYERQNKDNKIYTAREYETQDHTILMTPAKSNEAVKDPIYHKGLMTDASGNSRGNFDGYAFIGDNTGHNTDADFSLDSIGDFVIGGFGDYEQGEEGICLNPNKSIYILEDHNYDADPVNLQLNTYDCESTDFTYGKLATDDVNDDNVNLKGDYRTGGNSKYKSNEDGEDSFADERNTTDITYAPYLDHYNYSQTDWEIGAGYEGHNLTIGNFPILGVETIITDNRYMQHGERINVVNTYIDMNKHDQVYAYNNFTNATGDIGQFALDGAKEIGGHIYTETGQYEIYQAVWNTHEFDADNIDKFKDWSRHSDNVNFNGDERTPSSISSYKKNEDGKDSFAVETNTTDITYAPYVDDFNFEQHDYELQNLSIGHFVIKGIDKSAKETITEDHRINMNRHPAMDYAPGYDWKADYEDNSHIKTFNGGDTIGEDLYIDGEITYNYGENLPLGGFADPVNIAKNTLDPLNITYFVHEGTDDHGGYAAGYFWDKNEKDTNLFYNTETKEWENYYTINTGNGTRASFVQENPNGPTPWGDDNFGERLEKTEFWITSRDYWEIEEQNYVIGDDNEVKYVGGNPKPIQEPESTDMFWRATVGNEYKYPTYVNLMGASENDQIGEGYIGGELTHDEIVDAEVYKDIYAENDDTIGMKLAPMMSDRLLTWAEEENRETHTITEDVEYYAYRNYGGEIGQDQTIIGAGTYIGGEIADVNDEIQEYDTEGNALLNKTVMYFKAFSNELYEYNTFENSLNETNEIGLGYIGGELHSERVDADVYHPNWNTNEFDADTIDLVKDSSRLKDNVDFDEDTNTTVATSADEYYKYRVPGGNITYDDLEIGSMYIGGEIEDVNDEITDVDAEGNVLLNHSVVFFKAFKDEDYNYQTFGDRMNEGDNDTIGAGYIGGSIHEEKVNADVYKAEWNNLEYDSDISLFKIAPVTSDIVEYTTQVINDETQETETSFANDTIDGVKMDTTSRDYWEIEEQNYVVGDDGEVEYVGGKPVPMTEPVNTDMFWRATVGNSYRYPTYVNLAAQGDNDTIGEGYIGGELTHDEIVDAEVYKDIYTDDEITLDTIAPSIIDDTNNTLQVINKETNEKEDIWAVERGSAYIESDIGNDYYNYRNYGGEIGDSNIGDGFIGGELVDIDDNDNTDGLNSTTIAFTAFKSQNYVYNTFTNSLEAEGNIGDGFIGGELHEELVDADVYHAQWNTHEFDADTMDSEIHEKFIYEPYVHTYIDKDGEEQVLKVYTGNDAEGEKIIENVMAQEETGTEITHAPTYDEYNLRNADSKIGSGMIIGGTTTGDDENDENIFYIGGELAEIIEATSVTSEIKQGNNSYTTLEVAPPLVIGEGEIGDTYIKGRLVEWTNRDEESFMNVGDFDIFSDEQDWSMGVWKNDGDDNYTLLEDHNQSAAE